MESVIMEYMNYTLKIKMLFSKLHQSQLLFTVLLIFQTLAIILTQADKELKVGFLPTVSQNKKSLGLKTKHFIGAFLYSLNDINKNPNILSNQKLGFFFNDTKGDTFEALRGIKWQNEAGAMAIIGPEGSCVIEATIAAAWNIPIIAYNCRDSEVSNRTLYQTFARTVPPTSKVSKSVISVLKNFDWKKFVLVAGNSATWREAADTLMELASDNGIETSNVSYFEEPYIPKSQTTKRLQQIIMDTYQKTRIYVLLGENEAVIDFARYMYEQGISPGGEYVIISVHSKAYDPDAKDKYLLHITERWGPIEDYMMEAFKSVLTIRPRSPCNALYEEFLDKSRNYSSQEPFKAPSPPLLNFKMPVSITAAYLYDAVYVYAKALDEVLKRNGDPRNGTYLMSFVKGSHYKSIQGYDMFIDKNGDVEGNYTLLSLQEDPTNIGTGMSLKPVGYFLSSSMDIPDLDLQEEIQWINGEAPVDEPNCGFDGTKCRFKPDWQTAVICIIVVSLVVVTMFFLFRHYRYEQRLASLTWKIDYRDLLMAETGHNPGEDTQKGMYDTRLSFLQTKALDEVKELPLFNASSMPSYMKVASYKGSLVRVRMLRKRQVDVSRSLKKELHVMKEMNHDNINRFIGACLDVPNMCVVTQYCLRGSLQDILENNDLYLDDMFIASLVSDLVKGMIYLHDSEIGYHGNLKSTNCLVDSRWVLQISDFGLPQLKHLDNFISQDNAAFFDRLLWTAPEVLRKFGKSQKCDVYSFGLILYEIHGRSGPWGTSFFKSAEIISRVKTPIDCNTFFRPDVNALNCADFVKCCMQECWQEDPEQRSDFKYIRLRLKPMQKGLRANIFDNMLAIMEKYATNLEAVVEERTKQLLEEKKKTDALLLRMLPKSVADQLMKGNPVIPEQYDCVTIYFSDIVGFTHLSAQVTPMEVVDLLNDLYTLFDSIIRGYDVYKVETIGDAYMVVSGLPVRNCDNHAGEIGSMSLHLLAAIKTFRIKNRPSETLKLRVGIHSGSVCAGVVGVMMPRYCLFGDTVNTASRMESNGVALKIHCSKECKLLLDKLGGYVTEERGLVNMKGKGELLTYFILGEDRSVRLKRLHNHIVEDDRIEKEFPSISDLSSRKDDTDSIKNSTYVEINPMFYCNNTQNGTVTNNLNFPVKV